MNPWFWFFKPICEYLNCSQPYCTADRVLTYFDTPSFMTTALHIISIIAVPAHVFGAYCILFKTPSRMVSVKFSLLHLHVWATVLDLGFCFLTTPYILVPIMSGYPLGLLKYTGMTVNDQTYLQLAMLGGTAAAVGGIFENRYRVLSDNRLWKKLKNLWYLINFATAFTFYLPCYLLAPAPEDQKEARKFVFEMIPCLPEDARSFEYFVMDENPGLFIKMFGGEILFVGLEVFIFLLLTYRFFGQFGTRLSQRTIALQRKLIYTLILQVSIPLFIIVIPLCYCAIASWRRYHNQALNNVSFIIISTHGFVSTVAMILMHLPYREELFRVFGCNISRIDTSAKNSVEVQPTAVLAPRGSRELNAVGIQEIG